MKNSTFSKRELARAHGFESSSGNVNLATFAGTEQAATRRTAPHMYRTRAVSAACVALACILLPLAGFARKHSASPSTGLNNIYYGVRPPDFLYDVGKGATLLSWHYG
ncbi:MAG: hypothetical protein JO043_07290, partial [Candidatus Eremiobacteraeota bacterium]|nr:hypothetical protein [Candidatus Eremiobacteraeota bacterium]